MKKLVLLFTILCTPAILLAQSFEYYPMQPYFENESFFYHRVELTTQTYGPFSELLPGFGVSSPLNQLAQNPGWLPNLNGHNLYAYAEIRSRNMYKVERQSAYEAPPFPYTPLLINAFNYRTADGHRLDQEPFLSATILGYPFANKHLMGGITYQLITSREDYYAYPSNAYPPNPMTSDLASTGAAGPTSYFQKNGLKQTGHFLSFYGGYELSNRTMIGLRVGAALFQRDGGYGTQTYHPYSLSLQPVSTASPFDLLTEQRSQNYRHLSFDLGGRYAISHKLTGMAHLGYLIGSGNEQLNNTTPYQNLIGRENPGVYYYLSQNITSANDSWDNSGYAFDAGLSLQYDLTTDGVLSLFYEGYASHEGLTPSAGIQTSDYTEIQNPGGIPAKLIKTTQTNELHSGNGSENAWSHQIALFYNWSPTRILTLNFGIQYDHNLRNIHTLEASDITGFTLTQTTDTTGRTTTTRQTNTQHEEDNWTNRIHEHAFQIPFVARIRLLSRLDVWGGFDEQVESFRVKSMNSDNPPPPSLGLLGSSSDLRQPYPNFSDNSHTTRYRFTLLSGINFDVTGRLTLRLTALPLDHRYGYDRTNQTSGLIWQAGLSFKP
ncbi:MAG TPA: hypothetical protein VKA08_12010 [Balneolales bacterium]|nr:hypothetical protein [Balneolales bacterium]